MDPEKFRLVVNGSRTFTLDDFIEHGSYNLLMEGSALYDAKAMSFEESHRAFNSAMPDGFAWEVLDVFSSAWQLRVDPGKGQIQNMVWEA